MITESANLATFWLTLKLATFVNLLLVIGTPIAWVAGTPLLARITRRSAERLEIRPGLALRAQIKSVALLG